MKAWMSSNFGKFETKLLPLISVRNEFLLNILKTNRPINFLFLLWFNVPVNNFSVMLRRSHLFLGITSTFWGVNVSCSRKQTHRPGRGSNPGLPIRNPTL